MTTLISFPRAPYEQAFWPIFEEPLISDFNLLKRALPQYDNETVRGLLDVHRGAEGGHMITLGLVRTVIGGESYQIDGERVNLVKGGLPIDLEWEATHPPLVETPPHLAFTAEWDNRAIASGEGNNILGDNGGLFIDVDSLNVPIAPATQETLAYYGALLIEKNRPIQFPDTLPFPLWRMDVGSRYVEDYIMKKEEGGGFYLEFHNDQPHFHMIVNGGGYYLLAKEVSPNHFHLTAFELSTGQAVYTKKGAIHCDAALTGEIICGYAASEDCETVLLRKRDDQELVTLNFMRSNAG